MKVAIASLTLVAFVAWAEPDGGATDAGAAELATYEHLRQLATEYGCPPAPPPEVLDGGYRLEDPSRAARVDCELTRMSAEVFSWRGLDAGTVSPPPDAATLHLVTAIVTAASAAFTAYAANRSARHLALWPP